MKHTHLMKTMAAVTLSLLLCSPVAWAQFPDLSKALGQLPSLLRPGSSPPSTNAAAPTAGGSVSIGNTTVKGADLMQLLSQSLDEMDLARELEIGRQLSSVLLGSKPLYPDMALQRYVNQLGRWIALQSPRPELPWTFAILDDNGFNAFAAPGGFVFITKGLIDQIHDEGELAAILAHEVIHVAEKHHLKAMKSRASSNAATSIGAQLLGSQIRNSMVRDMISDQGLALVRDLYSRGLDRSDEFEADRTAVTLAASAGFDPYGLVSVLQGLRPASPDDALFSLSLSTHPPTQQRLDALEAAMGRRMDSLSGQPRVGLMQRLNQLKAAGLISTAR